MQCIYLLLANGIVGVGCALSCMQATSHGVPISMLYYSSMFWTQSMYCGLGHGNAGLCVVMRIMVATQKLQCLSP
jgi:hypothetical protein